MRELPWEVELLLSIQDNDFEDYKSWVEVMQGRYESGDMSEHEFRRFVDALRQVREYHAWVLKQTKKLVHKADNPHIKAVT